MRIFSSKIETSQAEGSDVASHQPTVEDFEVPSWSDTSSSTSSTSGAAPADTPPPTARITSIQRSTLASVAPAMFINNAAFQQNSFVNVTSSVATFASKTDHLIAKRTIDAFQVLKGFGLFDRVKKVKTRIKANPKKMALIVACIVIPIICGAPTPVILGAAGFGASGIAAENLGSGIQAGIGNMVAGSLFAFLTSAGMGGVALPLVILGVEGGSAVITAAVVACIDWWKGDSGGAGHLAVDANLVEDINDDGHEDDGRAGHFAIGARLIENGDEEKAEEDGGVEEGNVETEDDKLD